MANVIKIDNSILKRFAYKENKRKIESIPLRKYFLIVCEGEKTEPNYFESLKKNLPKGVIECIDIKGEGKNTLSLVQEAIKVRNSKSKKYDETWVVFDRDSFNADNFDNSIHKANNNKIKCAWSNEAFEFWYLLHFEFRNTAMKRDAYKKQIEKHIKKIIPNFIYQKNSIEMYDILQKYGNEKQAILNAGKLDSLFSSTKYSTHNPSTKVYKLVEELNKMNPDKNVN